jgi:hypothetical protein
MPNIRTYQQREICLVNQDAGVREGIKTRKQENSIHSEEMIEADELGVYHIFSNIICTRFKVSEG